MSLRFPLESFGSIFEKIFYCRVEILVQNVIYPLRGTKAKEKYHARAGGNPVGANGRSPLHESPLLKASVIPEQAGIQKSNQGFALQSGVVVSNMLPHGRLNPLKAPLVKLDLKE
ncbi:MAG: hypothetical protein COW89_07125 [Nitrospinae bacterium CG22_combo_CG10-13_8_21_14_all_47_10]|nr:MAG: hypothetical protein COW89_07125 [Nitrospinae bacterium CG22_combo_CG10-13_8_21_14_all_47_10]